MKLTLEERAQLTNRLLMSLFGDAGIEEARAIDEPRPDYWASHK